MSERPHPDQLSFLSPDDAELLMVVRRLVADVSGLYERRTGRAPLEAVSITCPEDAYRVLAPEMKDLPQEQIRTLNLNSAHRVVSAPVIYQGTVNQTTIRVAEILRPAIIDHATALILAHNHPSGELTPSPDDVRMTKAVVQAGHLFDIGVIDHLVIGRSGYTSMRELGLGFDT